MRAHGYSENSIIYKLITKKQKKIKKGVDRKKLMMYYIWAVDEKTTKWSLKTRQKTTSIKAEMQDNK